MYLQYIIALLCWLEQVAGCTEGELKFESDNRLIQICTEGQWGYICAKNNYQWSKKEAQVACQQMGMTSKFKSLQYKLPVISYSHFKCNGLEQHVVNCYHKISNKNATDCRKNGTYYYATTTCESTTGCKGGELSLDGKVLKICAFGQWHTLCGNTWTLAQAKVACRQLGRNPFGATNMTLNLNVPNDFIRFYCNGNEDSLRDCSVANNYDCPSDVAAALTCGEWPDPPHNLSVQQLESSIQLYWEYSANHTANVTAFNISCESQTQQSKYWYTIEIIHFNNTVNTSITGLLPNTTYTCCVLAVTSYGKSEPVCQNIVTVTVTTNSTNDICSEIIPSVVITTITSSDTIVSGGLFIAGGIIGVVSVFLVTVIVKVIAVGVRKNRNKRVENAIKYHNSCTTSQNATMEALSSPIHGGQVHQNISHDVTKLPVAESEYSYAVLPQTHYDNVYDSLYGTGIEGTATNRGYTVNSDIYSYDQVNNVKNEEVYSLVEDEIKTYSKLQSK